MDNNELERIQKELLAEEEVMNQLLAEEPEEEVSLEELLKDEELTELLKTDAEPAFDDPVKIHEPKKPLVYQNFANDYGAKEKAAAEEIRRRDQKTVMILMIVASALCLGIIGILGYWISFLP